MKVINEAVDEVRRQEQKDSPELFRTRYIWLKNIENLKPFQAETLDELTLKKLNLKISHAYHIKLNFQELFNQPVEYAETYLKKWYFWATHSRLHNKAHWDGVLQWFHSGVNNGILEGINSVIQAAKARACGYRTTRNIVTIIYLIAGKLNFGLPT